MRFPPQASLTLTLVLLSAAPAHAAWPSLPTENLAACVASTNQGGPVMVSDGAGGALIAWHDPRSGVDHDIYVQRILSSGVPDPNWPVNGRAVCTAAGDQSVPTIVSDGAGGAIIAWRDYRSGTSDDIYAQRVLASGVVDPAWPVNGRPVCTAPGEQSPPAMIPDGAGGAIFAWQDYRDAVDLDIFGQHVLASGALATGWAANGMLVCTSAQDQIEPKLVSDGAGGAIVTWVDSRPGTEQDIYAHHLLPTGYLDVRWPGQGRVICSAPRTQLFPELVSDGAGGAVITWHDFRNGVNFDIYAQRVSISGVVNPQWPVDGTAICVAPDHQFFPEIVGDGAGGAIVTWYDFRSGLDADIYAQRVLASGMVHTSWPANGRALCTAADQQYSPQIVSDGQAGAIVAWQDGRSGTSLDIYVQHVLASGALDGAWPSQGLALSTAPDDQNSPVVIPDGAQGAIGTWLDYRSGSADVYVQRVTRFGILGGP